MYLNLLSPKCVLNYVKFYLVTDPTYDFLTVSCRGIFLVCSKVNKGNLSKISNFAEDGCGIVYE
jgi:hypothetical protein